MASTLRSCPDGVYIIGPDKVAEVWAEAGPLLAKAVERAEGRASLDTCLREALSGERTLWVALENGSIVLAACTSILVFPGKKFLRIDQLGGSNLRAWQERGISAFKEWAARQGCSGLLIDGRRGWARVLGARIVSVRMEVEL